MKKIFLGIEYKRFLGLIFLFSSITIFAQTPEWEWARAAGGSAGETTKGLCKDPNGNIFATGSFVSPTINFGNTVLTNSGSNDAYIVKYDPQGNVVWAKSFGAQGSDVAYEITSDPVGNVIVVGWFSSPSISFGNIDVNNSGGNCSGAWGIPTTCLDIFIVKFDNDGNTVWARSFGTPGRWEYIHGVCSDINGNIYATGEFTGTISFDNVLLSFIGGSRGIFLTKFDNNGNAIWGKAISGGNNYCRAITADASGNVVIGGTYSLSITFDNIILTDAAGTFFLAKYNSSGGLLWAKGQGGRSTFGLFGDLAVNATGIYFTGSFRSSSIKFERFNLKNCRECTNMFLVKYDGSGNVQWARTASNTTNTSSNVVDVDVNGNVYIAGAYNNSPVTFGNITLTNNGYMDIFLAKYNSSGNVVWATGIGGSSAEGANNLITDGSFIYMSGHFGSPAISFGNNNLTPTGGTDLFFAKTNANGSVVVKGPSAFEKEVSGNSKVFPNPARGNINFEISVDLLSSDTRIGVFNILGVKLKEVFVQSALTPVSLNGFKPGMYFYRVTKKGKIAYSGKFIVQ